ncbi:MAG: phage tail assembly chaperone [Hyphomicrobiaceae bacterium]
MSAAFGVLRLAPDTFWRMTPRELAAALDAYAAWDTGIGPPSRSDLARLMQRFPD